MLTVKLLVLELGALLLYAGITGKSVGALLRGDNTRSVPNTSLTGGQNPAEQLLSGGSQPAPVNTAPTAAQTARQTSGFAEPVAGPLFSNVGAQGSPFTVAPGGSPFPIG